MLIIQNDIIENQELLSIAVIYNFFLTIIAFQIKVFLNFERIDLKVKIYLELSNSINH